MTTAQDRLYAIALGIQVRDNWRQYDEGQLRAKINELSGTGLFSLRQISQLCGKSPSTLSRWQGRASKTGGKFSPEDLEMYRSIIFQKDLGELDWSQVFRVIDRGTSVDFLARITGLPKSSIHRKLKHDSI
jgi:hypothetical protein